jgi:hypothetical protein
MYTTKQWAKADPNVAGLIAGASGFAAAYSGPPGVGKSQTILSWCRVLGYEPIILIGSTHPPEDFSGLPYVIDAKEFFDHVPARFLHRLTQPRAICLMDELTCVGPQTRAGMLSLLSERCVGNLKVHPSCIFIAAYNPPEMAPSAIPLERSVANRFYHAKWVHDRAAWKTGMVSEDNEFEPSWCPQNMPTAEEAKRFRPMFGEYIVQFTDRHSDMAETVPEHETDYAYATPRTWKQLRDALCVAEAISAPVTIKRQLMDGYVGKRAGGALAKYINELDLIDVEEAIANPSSFKHDRKRPDLTVALLTSVVSALEKNYSPERLENSVSLFCDNVAHDAADLVMSQLRHLCATRGEEKLTAGATKSIKEFGDRIPERLKRLKK